MGKVGIILEGNRHYETTEEQQLDNLRDRDWPSLRAGLHFGVLRRADPGVAELSAGWLLNGKGVGQAPSGATTRATPGPKATHPAPPSPSQQHTGVTPSTTPGHGKGR